MSTLEANTADAAVETYLRYERHKRAKVEMVVGALAAILGFGLTAYVWAKMHGVDGRVVVFGVFGLTAFFHGLKQLRS